MKVLPRFIQQTLNRMFKQEGHIAHHNEQCVVTQPEEQGVQNIAKTQEEEIHSIIKAMKESMNEHCVPFVNRRWKLEQHTSHYEIRHGGVEEWVEQLSVIEYKLTDTKTNVEFVYDTEDVFTKVKRSVYNALLESGECHHDVLEMTEFKPRLSAVFCSVPTFTHSQVADIVYHYYLNVFKKDVEHIKALQHQESVDKLKQMYNV